MEANATNSSTDSKYDLLLGKMSAMESQLENLSKSVLELNDSTKEYLSEETVLNHFGGSRTKWYRLVQSGKINAYNINGKGSTRYYKRSEINKLIENGIIKNKKAS